jgi:hypothetical protein
LLPVIAACSLVSASLAFDIQLPVFHLPYG